MKILLLFVLVLKTNNLYSMPVKFKVNNSKSSKGYEQTSIGAGVEITEKTTIDGNYSQSKDGTLTITTFDVGIDHTYNETYSFFGNLSSSKESTGLKGFGQSAGTDVTLSNYWDGELSTIGSLELGRTRYKGEETIANTLYKTDYLESYWKLGLEQEIVSWFSLSVARKKYIYKDNSTATTGRRTYADHLTSLSQGPDYKNTIGANFYKTDWPKVSASLSKIKNGDGSYENEQNYTLSYKISNFSIGGYFTHNKKSTGEVEDTFGPSLSTSF